HARRRSAATLLLVGAISEPTATECDRTFLVRPHLGLGGRLGHQLRLLPAIKERSWCLILPRVVLSSYARDAVRPHRISQGEIVLPITAHFQPLRQKNLAHALPTSPSVAW